MPGTVQEKNWGNMRFGYVPQRANTATNAKKNHRSRHRAANRAARMKGMPANANICPTIVARRISAISV